MIFPQNPNDFPAKSAQNRRKTRQKEKRTIEKCAHRSFFAQNDTYFFPCIAPFFMRNRHNEKREANGRIFFSLLRHTFDRVTAVGDTQKKIVGKEESKQLKGVFFRVFAEALLAATLK